MVFPAGVGPDSPSRKHTTWLLTLYAIQPVGCRLSVVGCRLKCDATAAVWLCNGGVHRNLAPFPSSDLVPFGRWWYARGRCCWHCHGKQLVRAGAAPRAISGPCHALQYSFSKHHNIRRGWRAARSSTSHGIAELLCTRIKGANREIFLKGNLIPGHVMFSSCES